MNIPYGHQTISEEDIKAVVKVLRSDYLTTGPSIEEFERTVADYVGAKYAVAVSNGTAALHIACLAAGIGEGDEVITTPITFAASANCILYCGGTPVFADIDERTYNIDPVDIERKITSKTKAIIPVHFTGQPCDMDSIYKIAKEHNLIVIEDGAHALGAEYKQRKIGGVSQMITFSFHPVKPITTGEGGMVVTNDEELFQRLKLFRSHGITREENMLQQNEGGWYYEQLELGFNYRMTDIQAALGVSQMKKIDTFLKRRAEIAQRYNEALKNIPNLIIPEQLEGTKSGWHLYVIQIKNGRRKEVFDSLRKDGIGVNVHYIPVYHHPYYRKKGYENTYCSNAEELYKNMITLPIYPGMDDDMQDFVLGRVLNKV